METSRESGPDATGIVFDQADLAALFADGNTMESIDHLHTSFTGVPVDVILDPSSRDTVSSARCF